MRFKQHIIPLFLTNLLLLQAVPTSADTVVLADHNRELQGTVTLVTPEIVQMKGPDGKLNILKRSDVVRIQFVPGTAPTLPPVTGTGTPPVKPSIPAVPVVPPSQIITQFPQEGSLDRDRFNHLSIFEGNRTRAPYAGLYHFAGKGTFWVQLPEGLGAPALLTFNLYGKRNKSQVSESFDVRARFFDRKGSELGQTPMVSYDAKLGGEGEWFRYLDGVAGLAGTLPVQWQVPRNTQVIELQAFAKNDDRRHLVGYIGQLILMQDAMVNNSSDKTVPPYGQ